MNVDQVIAAFLDHRRGRRRSARTIEHYCYQLEDLWLRWRRAQKLDGAISAIPVEEFIRYFDYLANEHICQNKRGQVGLSPETIGSSWRVLRAFWRYAARREWLAEEQRDFFKDDELIPRPAVDQRIRQAITDETLSALLAACENVSDPEEKARNRALLLLLAESGARISEIAGLDDEKLDLRQRRAKVIGKGNREEWIFWSYGTAVALRAYLRVRTGKFAGALFRAVSAQCEGDAMTTDAIRSAIKRLAQQAGVELPKGAPIHSFRHRYAHKGIDSGLDFSQVQQLMRHRHHNTTMRYLRENPDRLGNFHDRIKDLLP